MLRSPMHSASARTWVSRRSSSDPGSMKTTMNGSISMRAAGSRSHASIATVPFSMPSQITYCRYWPIQHVGAAIPFCGSGALVAAVAKNRTRWLSSGIASSDSGFPGWASRLSRRTPTRMCCGVPVRGVTRSAARSSSPHHRDDARWCGPGARRPRTLAGRRIRPVRVV